MTAASAAPPWSPASSRSRIGTRPWGNRTAQDAPLLDGVVSQVTITDPTHALFGQTLPVVPQPSFKGSAVLLVRLPGGVQRAIPRYATALHRQPSADPVPTTLLPVSVRTLLPLAHHVGRLRQATEERSDEMRSDVPPAPHDPHRPARDGTAHALAAPGTVTPPATGATRGRTDPAPQADQCVPPTGDFR
jgi:hypothetical protein